MAKSIKRRVWFLVPTVLACLLAASCAGGGSGGGAVVPPPPSPPPPPPPSPPPPPPPGPNGTYWDTLLTGSVASPARASFGAAPSAKQTATKGGPSFDGTNGANETADSFPVILSSLEATPNGLSASSVNQDATVSFQVTRYTVDGTLSIPSLNVSARIYWDVIDGGLTLLEYVALGTWAEPQSNVGEYGSITAFAFGYETAKTSMPTTGTAAFGGLAEATVFKPVDGSIRAAHVTGAAGLSVDFGSGAITGSFTGMTQSDYVSYANSTGHLPPVTGGIFGWTGSHPWNDVSVTATIAGGTNRFSGSTAVTSAPDTTFSLKSSAKGTIDGAFFGPNAENIGAIWSLSDGTGSTLGTVGATR